MGREIVGLKIGASKIAAARVATNGSGRLLQVAGADLPPGLVVGGEVQDVEGLGAVLKHFFAEHKLPRRGVRVGVSSNRVGVRTIDVGGIDDPKQLGNAVRFRAQEALPIPINEAVLDYQVLGESRDDEGKLVRKVLFVVAYRDLVERYAVACKHGGLKLAGVDLEAFALLRAVTPFAELPTAESERGAIVAVSVGSERSTLAVTDGTTCEFTRVLEWGGSCADDSHRTRPRHRARRCGANQALAPSQLGRDPRGTRPGDGGQGAAGDARRAADVRPRARLVAPVLPESAWLARHP